MSFTEFDSLFHTFFLFSKVDYLNMRYLRKAFMLNRCNIRCTCIACKKDLVGRRIEFFDYGITLGDFNISAKNVNSGKKLEKWFKAQLQEILCVSKHESHSKQLLVLLLNYLYPTKNIVSDINATLAAIYAQWGKELL